MKHFFLSTRYYVVEMIGGSNKYHHFMFYQFAGTGSTGMLGLISKGQVLLQLRMFTFHYHTNFFFVNTCKMYPIQQIIGIFIFLEVCSLILLWISFKFHTIQLRFNHIKGKTVIVHQGDNRNFNIWIFKFVTQNKSWHSYGHNDM